MLWDVIAHGIVARLNADAALTAVLGAEGIYPAQASRPVRIPSVEYQFDYDRIRESFQVMGLTLDIFAPGVARKATIERRIQALLHSDVMQDLAGRRVWIRYQDGRDINFPSDPGVAHRALDFEVEAVREKYD